MDAECSAAHLMRSPKCAIDSAIHSTSFHNILLGGIATPIPLWSRAIRDSGHNGRRMFLKRLSGLGYGDVAYSVYRKHVGFEFGQLLKRV
jgi:hypothetical protein